MVYYHNPQLLVLNNQPLLMVWCLLVMTQLRLITSVMLALYWLEQRPESVSLMEHGVVLLNLHPNMSILFIHAHNMILSTCLSIA